MCNVILRMTTIRLAWPSTAILALLLMAIPAWAAAPLSNKELASLEARLQHSEDLKAIERVLVEYGRTLDNRDFAAYSALFAAEGEWKGGFGSFKGPANIKAAMEKTFAAATEIPKGNNFHIMSNFDITVTGDHATANSMFVFYRMNGSKPEPVVAGRYIDTLIRENGQWKFLQRNAVNP